MGDILWFTVVNIKSLCRAGVVVFSHASLVLHASLPTNGASVGTNHKPGCHVRFQSQPRRHVRQPVKIAHKMQPMDERTPLLCDGRAGGVRAADQ